MQSILKIKVVLLLALLASWSAQAAEPAAAVRVFRDAPQIAKADAAPILAATLAGKRVVAVGDFGIVILSDDGKSFRQAKTVPTRSALTSVFFIDDQHGWAVGHDGTVIASSDAGETWQVLREEPGKDRVLLAVWFENPQHGFAVGQFGLVLETGDGGKIWHERRLIEGESGDKHLLQIFPAGEGLVLIAAEAGTMLRSEDSGSTWKLVQTNNKGSFWTGLALNDGTLLAAGMRGHIYRSADRGLNWTEVPSGTQQSLTAIVQGTDGGVRLVGLSGTMLNSKDQGQSFQGSVLAARTNLTAIAIGPAGELLFSLSGVVKVK